jgi:hypothetical protein
VRRQQELVRLLKREGHAVTQSSISRDLRELGVLKASDGHVLPDTAELSRALRTNSRRCSFVREVHRRSVDHRGEDHDRFRRAASPRPSTRPADEVAGTVSATIRFSSPPP